MIKTSKKLMIIALLSLSSLAAWAACATSPYWCNLTASVTVPPGGSCFTFQEYCFAIARSYDANGNIYQSSYVRCPNCIDP